MTAVEVFKVIVDSVYSVGMVFFNGFLVLVQYLANRIAPLPAIFYVIWQDLILPLSIIFGLCLLYDKIAEVIREKFFELPPRGPFAIRAVDRFFAFLSVIYVLIYICLYFKPGFIVNPDLRWIPQTIRSLIFLYNWLPFLQFMILPFVFRVIVRRRGADTEWIGPTYPDFIKHFVRYCWCFAWLISFDLQLFNIVFYKIIVKTERLPKWKLKAIITAFLYIVLSLVLYLAVCAVLGRYPYLPGMHRGCTFHVGRRKGEADNFERQKFQPRLWFLRSGEPNSYADLSGATVSLLEPRYSITPPEDEFYEPQTRITICSVIVWLFVILSADFLVGVLIGDPAATQLQNEYDDIVMQLYIQELLKGR